MSKIVVTVRTRNEETNIGRFCHSYRWADAIIVADGGSSDKTMEIAKTYKNTIVVEYGKKIYSANGAWRNPHGGHLNFLFNRAKMLGADWIIHDDCDCFPNKLLVESARAMIETCDKPIIDCYRMYVYGTTQWFPDMNKPGQSLWAWNVHRTNIYADENNPWMHVIKNIPSADLHYRVDFPKALMHFFALDEETIQRKLSFYSLVEGVQNPKHPLHFCGRLALLPEWAILED